MKKILLLVSLISLVAFSYFKNSSENQATNKIFENINTENINKITFIAAENTVKLKKQEQNWEIIQPVPAAVNKEFISLFDKFISELTPESVIDANEVEAEQSIYGLIPPEMLLIIEGSFGKEVISFGKHVDFASARYLQKEKDNKIYLIKEDLFTLLNLDLNSIRSSHPIEFETDSVQSIAVLPDQQPAFVIKKNLSSWVLESVGLLFEVDRQLFQSALEKLAKLEVVEFRDQEISHLELFGLDRPILTIRILLTSKGNSRVLDLIFGKGIGKEPFYYLREVGKTSVYRIFRAAMSDWIREIDFFRYRQLFPISPDKVTINGKSIELDKQTDLTKIVALSALNASAFKTLEPKISMLCSISGKELVLELGDKVSAANQESEDSPSFVKINSDNQQYVLILSAKDMEILKGLSQL